MLDIITRMAGFRKKVSFMKIENKGLGNFITRMESLRQYVTGKLVYRTQLVIIGNVITRMNFLSCKVIATMVDNKGV